MIGQSTAEYLFIRTCILALRAVAPLSLAYVFFCLYNGISLRSWFGVYALAESAFVFNYALRKRSLQKATEHPPLLSQRERQALFERCAANLRKDHAAGWFLDAESPKIGRENVIDWLLWALFSTSRDGRKEEWDEELNSYIKMVENALGHPLDDGVNEDLRSMRLTLDPVVMLHRPLIWYTIVACVDAYSYISMTARGFSHYDDYALFNIFPPRPITLFSRKVPTKIPYWYHPHTSKGKLPVVFIHGIGIGLWPYLPYLAELRKRDPDVGIIVLELLPISMRMTHAPLSRHEACAALYDILSRLKIDRFVLVAHSYGTVVSSHILHDEQLSHRVASTLLIDPIPFLLHQPSVAHNFVYRQPKLGNEWQLWYFASRDPDISRALSRHFFWADNILWKEELLTNNKHVAVALSGRDQIVDAKEVWRYLTDDAETRPKWVEQGKGLEVLWYDGLDHSQCFDTPERRSPLVDVVHRFVHVD